MCLRNISESVKLLSAGRSYGINIFRSMPQRLNFYQTNSEAIQPMLMLEKYLRSCGLEKPLLELVKLRSSQINGCAYCIDMHTKDARAAGETEQRLYLLNAWPESPFYSDRERAALEWTEAVTLVSATHVPDEIYENVRRHFSEQELLNLTMAVVAINGWNRLAISFRSEPGIYQVRKQSA
jgi:AhpD family alkylhydroperoxidase